MPVTPPTSLTYVVDNDIKFLFDPSERVLEFLGPDESITRSIAGKRIIQGVIAKFADVRNIGSFTLDNAVVVVSDPDHCPDCSALESHLQRIRESISYQFGFINPWVPHLHDAFKKEHLKEWKAFPYTYIYRNLKVIGTIIGFDNSEIYAAHARRLISDATPKYMRAAH